MKKMFSIVTIALVVGLITPPAAGASAANMKTVKHGLKKQRLHILKKLETNAGLFLVEDVRAILNTARDEFSFTKAELSSILEHAFTRMELILWLQDEGISIKINDKPLSSNDTPHFSNDNEAQQQFMRLAKEFSPSTPITPKMLCEAAEHGWSQLVRFFLQRGANPDAVYKGHTFRDYYVNLHPIVKKAWQTFVQEQTDETSKTHKDKAAKTNN